MSNHDILLFCHGSMESLAQEIAHLCPHSRLPPPGDGQMTPVETKLLGDKLYPLVAAHAPEVRGKEETGQVVGLLMTETAPEILAMVDNPALLKSKVEEAAATLDAAVSVTERQQPVRSESVDSEPVSLGEAAETNRGVAFQNWVKWDHFRDGFPNIFIDKVKQMEGKDVILLASFHKPEVVFEQVSLIYAVPRYLARSFTLILPYFPTGTMERVDKEGQVATAKTLATLLSAIPLTARGPAQIVCYDIHALQERFYFDNSVIPRLETAVPLLIKALSKLIHPDKVSIAFPDEGACKRFSDYFSAWPVIVCSKVRRGDSRLVKVREGSPSGRHCVIVDDLVQTGGTLRECAKVLRGAGALEVSAYVTHAVFPQQSWRSFADEGLDLFSNFWITDSIPHAREIARHQPFKLLSLAKCIASMLRGFDLRQ